MYLLGVGGSLSNLNVRIAVSFALKIKFPNFIAIEASDISLNACGRNKNKRKINFIERSSLCVSREIFAITTKLYCFLIVLFPFSNTSFLTPTPTITLACVVEWKTKTHRDYKKYLHRRKTFAEHRWHRRWEKFVFECVQWWLNRQLLVQWGGCRASPCRQEIQSSLQGALMVPKPFRDYFVYSDIPITSKRDYKNRTVSSPFQFQQHVPLN